MPSAASSELKFEIGHVLFIDIVGYSKLLSDQQRELFHLLNEVVRGTAQFRAAETASKLVRLSTGDGMVLAFFGRVDAPVRCAQEISRKLREHPELKLRMGINSGPVDEVRDVNNRPNVTGTGVNLAQRVMDCGDAGHILLSRRVAEDLAQYSEWQACLHQLGEVEVKHGIRVDLANFFGDDFGNPGAPAKLTQARKARRRRILSWAAAGAVLLLCLTIGSWAWTRRAALTSAYRASVAGISEKSIAVLPLENLTEEKENAFFADGMQEELLSNLAKIKDLQVISRTSVMQYKSGLARNLKEIARQLGVSKVVEGSVRRSANRVRVSVQLIDALNDRHIWSENYDRSLSDSLGLQGELATEIAAAVGATISPQEKARVEAPPTKNTAAYDAYLRGRAVQAGLSDDNWEKAAQAYQEAVTLDPSFTLAWVYLSAADSAIQWERHIQPTPALLAAAKDAADRAVALDPNLPEIHLAVGYYRYYGLHDYKGALEEFQLAEKGLPNDVGVLRAIGLIQRRLGRWDEVVSVMRRVLALDPRNTESAEILSRAYYVTRNYSDQIAVENHILALEPSNEDAKWGKLIPLWGLGNLEAAEQLLASQDIGLSGSTPRDFPSSPRAIQAWYMRRFAEAADLFSKDQNNPWNTVRLGLAQQRAGNVAAAKAAFQQAVQKFTENLSKAAAQDIRFVAYSHSLLGEAYAGLGDASRAISEGQKGMETLPVAEDAWEGSIREGNMARIYAMLGNADGAMPILERWIHVHADTQITPTLLRIDPIWDPIRNDPRFQKLCQEPNN